MTKSKGGESPYNFLYDNTYRLCSQTNYEKSVNRAKKFSEKKFNVPIFSNMYSDVANYPRFEEGIKTSNIIPPWLIKDYDTSIQKINSYLLRYSGLGCDFDNLKDMVPEKYRRPTEPDGMDRYRYFIKPLIPRSLVLQPDVMLVALRQKRAYYLKMMEKKSVLQRSIGTQTMYRDSSMQTDPYSPGFLLRPGAEPEILTLIPLSYGNGLPVGYHEITVIERARHRRALEERYKDNSLLREKRREINKLEVEEWQIRERQIEELQEARIGVMIKLMGERKQTLESIRREMMKRIYDNKMDDKEEKLKIVQFEYIKAIRKLLHCRKKVTIEKEDKSIILQYSNPMSQVWAPLTRIGQFFDRRSERYVVNNEYLTTFNGLTDLEDCLPAFVKNPNVKVPKLNMFTKDGYKRKQYRFEDELKELYKHLKSKDQQLLAKKFKQLKFLQKLESPVVRPPTPTMNFNNSMDYDEELGIILLQQMVRGRAIQVMFYEGKEKRIELIRELRSTHALHGEEIKMKEEERRIIENIQQNRILNLHYELIKNDYLGNLKGQSLGDIFDFLNKELIRLQEERKIHALIMLAERERRMREAEESGLRQTEERRRREEDEIFKQVVKVHQTTVKSYLEYIINDNVSWQAESKARIETEIMAININEKAYKLEPERNYLQTEEIVSDLVHHFLIPEVYKTEHREKIALNQRRFLLAAHREILKTTDDAVNPGPKLESITNDCDAFTNVVVDDDENTPTPISHVIEDISIYDDNTGELQSNRSTDGNRENDDR